MYKTLRLITALVIGSVWHSSQAMQDSPVIVTPPRSTSFAVPTALPPKTVSLMRNFSWIIFLGSVAGLYSQAQTIPTPPLAYNTQIGQILYVLNYSNGVPVLGPSGLAIVGGVLEFNGSPVGGSGVTTTSPLQGTTSLSCPTCGVTGTNLSQFASGGAINPASTGATTPGTGAFTTLSATQGINAISDGVHPSSLSGAGNTTEPAIGSNSVVLIWPNVAIFSGFGLQIPSVAPSAVNSSFWCAGALSNLVSAISFCNSVSANGIATTPTDGLEIVNNTAATSGVPTQISPSLHFRAQVWNTTTPANNFNDWITYVSPTTGAFPFSTLTFAASSSSSGTPSYATIFSLDQFGDASFGGAVTATKIAVTNCSAAGSAASPSLVACSAASSGAFSCATNASTATCVISTTAVTANSNIFIQPSAAAGPRLSVTCNTTSDTGLTSPRLASISAGTSFTINLGTFAANPECFNFWIAD